MELPDHIHPNDLIAALNAGMEAIKRVGDASDPMADFYVHVLRDFREEVVHSSR